MIYAYKNYVPKIDPTAYVAETAVVIGNVKIGPRCYVGHGAVIRGDSGAIVLEEEVAVEDNVVIHVGGRGTSSRICRRVTIGHGAVVHSDYIGPSAVIGMKAVVSLFSRVGEYAIVGEGALVAQGKSVPDRTVVGGIPAVSLRPLEQRDVISWEKSKDWYVKLCGECLDTEQYRRIR